MSKKYICARPLYNWPNSISSSQYESIRDERRKERNKIIRGRWYLIIYIFYLYSLLFLAGTYTFRLWIIFSFRNESFIPVFFHDGLSFLLSCLIRHLTILSAILIIHYFSDILCTIIPFILLRSKEFLIFFYFFIR